MLICNICAYFTYFYIYCDNWSLFRYDVTTYFSLFSQGQVYTKGTVTSYSEL